jgi:hypothetical protein
MLWSRSVTPGSSDQTHSGDSTRSLYLLLFRPAFFHALDAQLALFAFFSACHFSQFVYNLPVLMRGSEGPDVADFCHRRGAIRRQSGGGSPAGGSRLTEMANEV